jgi:hypothetical protein
MANPPRKRAIKHSGKNGRVWDAFKETKSFARIQLGQHPLFGDQPTYSLALNGTLQALAETGA